MKSSASLNPIPPAGSQGGHARSLGGLPPSIAAAIKIIGIVGSLYLFIVGVSGMGYAFNLFGKEFAEQLLSATSNPLTALSVGILATAIVQSSSTTTSIIVGLVAAGAVSGPAAVFMIMGANIGTTLTSMLVSLGHIHRKQELERAFSVAAIHSFFNLLSVSILFPLEWRTGILSRLAETLTGLFQGVGGMRLSNPLKTITEPTIELISILSLNNGWVMLVVTIALTFGMLIAIVKILRSLVLHKLEHFFDTHLFRNSGRAMLFGMLLTFMVQTSSISTALVVPLAGAGVLRLIQVYPFCLGSNLGTTMTAMLAALATGSDVAVTAAFTHLLFNLMGILMIWPIPFIRRIPVHVASALGRIAAKNRFFPFLVMALVYFLVPAFIILIVR